ncbi:MAG TPA: shikimate kinase [Candidatus Nanopelagicales bacterium]|nr:shikimate kinase [Candidatus Nanopelagicales bacterium]
MDVVGAPAGGPGRVWLVGSMGAGKSTVGRALAELLGVPLLDNDLELARETGRSTLALAAGGERALHQQESDQLRRAARRPGPFVAGVAASVADRPEDLALLRRTGTVVYLRAAPETLAARVSRDPARPFVGEDPEPWLAVHLERRDPVYLAAAQLTVAVDGRTVRSIVAEIVAALAARPGRPER